MPSEFLHQVVKLDNSVMIIIRKMEEETKRRSQWDISGMELRSWNMFSQV